MNTQVAERTPRAVKERVKILCVDDEPALLEGVALHLRRAYEVQTATSGENALQLLDASPDVAVIVSDMRMPAMDGATFLGRSRQLAPDATRILLTGQTDLDSAIAAVNEGQVFRFLTKPCAPAALLAAIASAAQQYRLVTAERVLLEHTVHGSIKALTDVLALTHPTCFGRANRIKQLTSELAQHLRLAERWRLEVAAMLSQLGAVALPPETAERVYFGQPLTEQERKMLERVPQVTDEILGNIPRLEAVREILSHAQRMRPNPESDPGKELLRMGAEILRAASDFDALETQGNSSAVAVDTLWGREGQYDERVLQALAAVRGRGRPRADVREIPVNALREGMVIAEDVRMVSGTLIVTRGFEVTPAFAERARNFRAGTVREPVRVVVRGTGRWSP